MTDSEKMKRSLEHTAAMMTAGPCLVSLVFGAWLADDHEGVYWDFSCSSVSTALMPMLAQSLRAIADDIEAGRYMTDEMLNSKGGST